MGPEKSEFFFTDISGQPMGPVFKGSMGPIFCTETSVINYHYSLRNNPEERSSHLLGGESMKSWVNQSLNT
jgi:hypothetical protein